MCHIYSGTNEIPDSIDLLELAGLTDLLGLEGLRENISQTIRVKFCHNFHRVSTVKTYNRPCVITPFCVRAFFACVVDMYRMMMIILREPTRKNRVNIFASKLLIMMKLLLQPCTGCISGVLECLPIALTYEMDELHRKMTKWICKHFVRIWPTKAFANLGEELIDKCLRYSVNHLVRLLLSHNFS